MSFASPNQSKLDLSQSKTVYQNQNFSPAVKRIHELNYKLQDIQNLAESERNQRKQQFESKVITLQNQLEMEENQSQAKFKLLNEQIKRVKDNIDQEVLQQSIIEEKAYKELKLVDKNFNLSCNNQHQEKKEQETSLLSNIDNKITNIQQEIAKSDRNKQDAEDQRIQVVENRNSDLRKLLETEKSERDQQSEEYIKYFGHEILKLQELMVKEKNQREQQHNNLMQSLEQLNNNLISELEEENDTRQKAEEAMVRLLEDTCKKIEGQLLN